MTTLSSTVSTGERQGLFQVVMLYAIVPNSLRCSTSIEEHGVEAKKLSDVDGLEPAYKKGYLHAAYTAEDGYALYDFPTSLHHR